MVVALMGYNMDLWEEKNGVRTAAPDENRQFFSRFLAKLETFESLEATFFPKWIFPIFSLDTCDFFGRVGTCF